MCNFENSDIVLAMIFAVGNNSVKHIPVNPVQSYYTAY